jgi:hypothetical protein
MCGEAVMAELLGCSVELRWLNHRMVWVQLRWLEPIRHKRGFWVGAMLTLTLKPQWVCYKLDETIEQPCSDFLAHTSKVCKGADQYNKYSAFQG